MAHLSAHRRVGAVSVLLIATSSGAAFAGGPVFCDPFDDGTIDPGWTVVGSDPAILGPVEQNARLEYPAQASDSTGDFGGVASLWTVDALADFRVQVDYHVDAPLTGEVGLSFAVVFDGDLPSGVLTTGITMDIGRESGDPFVCVGLLLDGVEAEVCELPVAGSTMYMWYDTGADVLRASYVAFDDPSAPAAADMRALSGADRAQIYLGAFTTQNAPAVPGSDLYMDDFCLVEGTILPNGDAPADVNGDGSVNVLDLLAVILGWGICPPGPCPADVNGDGIVDVADMVAVIVAWGS